jgi:hypothetical protein
MTTQLPYHPRTQHETDQQSGQNGIGGAEGEITENIETRDSGMEWIQQVIEHQASFRFVLTIAARLSRSVL